MELNQKINDAASKLMETLTKGYHWYHDTPEQPFEYTKGSIWLINPETEKWMLELQKDGHLWYYDIIFDTFSKYLSMEETDIESFIKVWVEDALERGVVTTEAISANETIRVEDVLERGVTTMEPTSDTLLEMVEDVLENGKQWN